MSEPPLPDLHQATLSDEEFAALLRDLGECTQMLSIRVRGLPLVGAPGLAIDDVAEALGRGAAIQITYRFDGATWIDTLTRADSRTRVVRIRRA